jgi:hypothetical protein
LSSINGEPFKPFRQIYLSVLNDRRLSADESLILLHLVGQKKEWNIDYKQIHERYGIGRNRFEVARAHLYKMEYLQRHREGKRWTKGQLNWEKVVATTTPCSEDPCSQGPDSGGDYTYSDRAMNTPDSGVLKNPAEFKDGKDGYDSPCGPDLLAAEKNSSARVSPSQPRSNLGTDDIDWPEFYPEPDWSTEE